MRQIEMGAGIPLGEPVLEVGLRILNQNHEERSPGGVGEIWVSGAHVARGYFSNPKANAANKQLDTEGRLWHRMGDVGYRDASGCLWLVGRVNTVIMRDNQPMYPVPVETVVEKLRFVDRAALVGAAKGSLPERTVLFVQASKDIPMPGDWRPKIESLLLQCGWSVDEIRLTRKIPVDARHNARIDYQRLQKMAAG
jgi:acyl-CoA synthetase (AMP-forming)/AMP-acid ligase II